MSRESILRKAAKSKGYKRSLKQEEELAARGRTRRVVASGAGPEKGDVKKYAGVWRIEAKTTSRKSFSVTRDMISKIEDAALPHGEMPAIVIEFLDKNGKPECEVCVVPSYALDMGEK